jgi:hypothetical protein
LGEIVGNDFFGYDPFAAFKFNGLFTSNNASNTALSMRWAAN